jgi:hypothetical protein
MIGAIFVRNFDLMKLCCNVMALHYAENICNPTWLELYLTRVLFPPSSSHLVCSMFNSMFSSHPDLAGPLIDMRGAIEKLQTAEDFHQMGAIKAKILACPWLLSDAHFMREYHHFVSVEAPDFLLYMQL